MDNPPTWTKAVGAMLGAKCCVAGCSSLNVDEEKKTVEVDGKVFKEGDKISLDGSTGTVYEGEIKTVQPELLGDFATIMQWADDARKLKVRANADNPRDAKQAVEFGAEGIGL